MAIRDKVSRAAGRVCKREWESRVGKIAWFADSGGGSIRLQMADAIGFVNAYPKNEKEAEEVWSCFVRAAMSDPQFSIERFRELFCSRTVDVR